MYIKELQENFTTKKEAFKALKEAKETIIQAKKSEILKSIDKLGGVPLRPLKVTDAIKGLDTSENMYHIVVNTTNVLDSHDDLHVKGIWNKTIKDQKGKLNLVVDHDLSVNGMVARKEHVKVSVIDTTFKALGYNLEGETQALVYSVHEDNIKHEKALEWLKSGDSIEASVRMQYVDIELALKSEDEEDEEQYKAYKQYSGVIANKGDREEEVEYFWIVKQAKNVSESSLVVAGSNSYTGVYEPSNDTQKDTQNIEPSKDTQDSKINYKYLIDNLK